jgi:hypothetical protein
LAEKNNTSRFSSTIIQYMRTPAIIFSIFCSAAVLAQPPAQIQQTIPVILSTTNTPPPPKNTPLAENNSRYITGFKQVRENMIYRIACHFSGKQVEVEDGFFSKGKKIQQWEWNDGDVARDAHNQRWMLLIDGYDGERGYHFKVMNVGFLKFLAHIGEDRNVICGSALEYSYSCRDQWYLKPIPNIPNALEIRSVHNNMRLRLAAPNADNGTGFIIETANDTHVDAAFKILKDAVTGPEARFVNFPIKLRNDDRPAFSLSVWLPNNQPVLKETGNVGGYDFTEKFLITPAPNNYYYIKNLHNKQFLSYSLKQKQFSFLADSLNNDTYWSIIPLERQKGKYYLRPVRGECLLGTCRMYIPGAGSSATDLGPRNVEDNALGRWMIEF